MSAEAQPSAANAKAARVTFGSIGGVVALLSAVGGIVTGLVTLFAMLGTPLFAVMAGATELAWLTHHDPEQQFLRRLASEVFGSRFAGSPILTTIPLFTFVGYLMAESKTPERLVRAATAWVGWLPGGLAVVCVIASAVFTLFTGGSGVTIIAVGGLLLPALRQKGYSEKFALGLVTTGGSLGLLLPFALPLLVYAMVTGLDFQLVNKAVILPGVLVLVFLSAYSMYVGVKEKIPTTPLDGKEIVRATWAFKWEIGIFVLLFLAITRQLASIDEAAGLVAAYTLVIEVFVYKDLSLKKDLVRIAKSSMALAGAVILILAMANAFVNYVVQEQLPDKALEAMLKIGLDKTWQFLIVMNVFLLVLGMVMDGISAILVAVPLVLPFASYFGLGPFHVAIMFVLNLELAFSCPPLGLNIFISSFRFSRPVVSLYRIVLPFAGLLALALLVITYVPRISNQLVLGDIQKWRDQAAHEKRPPTEAWFLECVQLDRNNPQPCSEEDKKAFPKGQMPESAAPPDQDAADAGAGAAPSGDEDDDLAALIGGKAAGEAGAGDGGAAKASEEDDLLDAIKGAGGGAGGTDAGAAAPKPKPGQESDDDLSDMIKGTK
jgi:tripartite ATP-independent transporter DctM subunit